jgi:hypothetical protein
MKKLWGAGAEKLFALLVRKVMSTVEAFRKLEMR